MPSEQEISQPAEIERLHRLDQQVMAEARAARENERELASLITGRAPAR